MLINGTAAELLMTRKESVSQEYRPTSLVSRMGCRRTVSEGPRVNVDCRVYVGDTVPVQLTGCRTVHDTTKLEDRWPTFSNRQQTKHNFQFKYPRYTKLAGRKIARISLNNFIF